jgi:8-oxo-dGTP pyrophosphatase MutT (NUDIX family)
MVSFLSHIENAPRADAPGRAAVISRLAGESANIRQTKLGAVKSCMDYWKPNVTVAAVIERDGLFLMVEEQTREGLRLNQPAGHLDPGESLEQAAIRETLEETAHHVEPVAWLGSYMGRYLFEPTDTDVTYLRFAFVCRVVAFDNARPLDTGIERAVWLSADQIAARRDQHRSPLVQRTVDDYLAGRRLPLQALYTHPSCLMARV